MPWLSLWDGLKNKTCRYLLQRYLGQFLEEKLNLEQLNVELYHGRATVKDVSLKVDALNDLFEAHGWSVEVTGGRIGLITVTVPWNALMTHDSSIQISDLFICLRPVQRQNNGTSMLESMWSSVSSSLQLAQECMKQTDDECDVKIGSHQESIDGLEKFAETIDNVLNRIKAKCTNVILRLEYIPEGCMHGIAIVIKINSLNYRNDSENNKHYDETASCSNEKENIHENENISNKNIYKISTFATHNISVNDVYVYTEEFKVPYDSTLDCERSTGEDSNEGENFCSLTSEFSSLMLNQNKHEGTNDLHQPMPSEEKSSPREKNCESIPVPIIRMEGQQKCLLTMKQSEKIDGPKVIFDIELGPICLVVTPRQIHILLQFYDLFSDEANYVAPSRNPSNMPSSSKTPEEGQKQHYKTSMTGSLGTREVYENIWSDTRDEFISSTENLHKQKIKSDFRYSESINSSMSSSSNVTVSSRSQRKMANVDICGDISKFNVKIATILAIILHEDVIAENNLKACSCPLDEKSQHDMIEIAEKCFLTFSTEYKHNIFERTSKLCNRNHFLLQFTAVTADGIQQRNRSVLLLKVLISATMVDLYEILDNVATPLINFNRNDISIGCCNQLPELSINVKSSSPFNIKRHDNTPKTVFDISVQRSVIEFDISIYDRLSAIIGPSPFKNQFLGRHKNPKWKENSSESCQEINVLSEEIGIKLRFPILHVRSINDPDPVPFPKQNIRADFLLITFNQIHLTYGLEIIEITAKQINAFYCENSLETKTHLLKVSSVSDAATSEKSVLKIPKIIIKTQKPNCMFHEASGCESSDTGSFINNTGLPFSTKHVCRENDTIQTKSDPSDESETFLLPAETREMKKFCDSTMKSSKVVILITIPAAALELQSKQLYEVIYNRLNADIFMWKPLLRNHEKSTEYQNVPEMKQSILNIGLFDSIYVPSSTNETTENYEHQNHFHTQSKIPYEMSSSFESEHNDKLKTGSEMHLKDPDLASIYVSAQESNNEDAANITATEKRSKCSVEVSVDRAELTLLLPTRDSENRVLPGQLGKIIAKLKALGLFFVNGHNSNQNLSYMCLTLKNLEVFHCGAVPVDGHISINMGSEMPSYMQSTFYKTHKRLTKGGRVIGCNKREMVSLVIEIKKIPEQNIKRLKITTGIQKTAFRHNPAPTPQTWLCQLIDFFNVMDYPIEGYEPQGIVTEMQLHLWDCAIDYRPKNFPYRSVVEIGTFNISSNIISSIKGCTLRFVAEDCVLSIAPFDNTKNQYPDNRITNLPSSDLVPTLDVGLLDISLRISDKATSKCPKLDLRTLIKDVHLRTCSDSGSALAQLIAYLANDGDIPACTDDGSISPSLFSSTQSNNGLFEASERKSSSADISDEQQERVNKLMAEAVIEHFSPSEACSDVPRRSTGAQGIEVFYFPDENSRLPKPQINPSAEELAASANKQESDINELREIVNFEANVMVNSYGATNNTMEALPQIKEDLGDISVGSHEILNEDDIATEKDDYCLIADEEKSYISNFGIKSVNLSEDPLRIVDNHFCLPEAGKADMLKSPENFPMAVQRYTLCEMSFTWHLYGGNDFPLNEVAAKQSGFKASNNDNKEGMSKAYKHGVSYSKNTDGIQFGKKPKERLTWKTRGGHNRNHEVLVEVQLSKVRFSHEVYPTHTLQASRQVLVINEIEIRDRLQTSDINKFLYHPRASNLPTKNHQNMVVIKALQVRPNAKVNLSQECSLRISLLPLRLHIDQDTLLFLVEFLTNLGDRVNNEAVQSGLGNDNTSSQGTSDVQEPIMMVDDIPEAVQDLHARRMVSTNLDLLMEDNNENYFKSTCNEEANISIREDATPIYFREVVFSPEVQIRFDYHGRRVELSRGPVAGLLMGLGQLQCSEIKLKKITYRRGLLGIEKLITYLCKEWLKDIKKNQLPNILSGVGPTYAFIQLFQGIYDLFWLPIEQFQRDGRIIRGLQLGAQSFTARTALAALEITSRIIHVLQFTAETAFDMVSPGPTVRRSRILRKGRRKRHHRPKDILEGVTNAYTILKEGFNDSAQTLIHTAVAEHDQKGYTGAVGAVMRQIPQLVVCPAVLATQATTNILSGVKNSLVPEAKLEARDKWKDDDTD